jgi:tetratricopeptide (TPR) repeat protein
MGDSMTSSLQLGINAAKAGRMQEALEFLKDAIIEEPQNAEVWVWIAAIIDDMDKQAIFLEKALEIDPHNIPAQRGLAYLEKRRRDEASVKDDHLSDYTQPISPFPLSGGRKKPPVPRRWPEISGDELDGLAQPVPQEIRRNTPPDDEDTQESSKLTPFEISLLGVIALVFCIIGLLAASALFDFELPLRFLQGERSPLVSEPPYPGVFLYENEMFFDIQQHQGLPTQEVGIPSSSQTVPLVVLWGGQAIRDQMKLIYETGAYIPIRGEELNNGTVLIQPGRDLLPGLYCFQQLNQEDPLADAAYWCFKVALSPVNE